MQRLKTLEPSLPALLTSRRGGGGGGLLWQDKTTHTQSRTTSDNNSTVMHHVTCRLEVLEVRLATSLFDQGTNQRQLCAIDGRDNSEIGLYATLSGDNMELTK